MLTKHITVTNRVALYSQRDGYIICGNDDYQIKFTFDSEWEAHSSKTARFKWNGAFYDVPFTGDTVTVPRLIGTTELKVGVYAGETLCTSTDAVIKCVPSCLCGTSTQAPGADEPYYAKAKAEADRAEAAVEAAAQTVVDFAAKQLLGGIVQTTGDSETQVMSQKAVTAKFKVLIDVSAVQIIEKGFVSGKDGKIYNAQNYNTTDYIDVARFNGGAVTVTSAIVGDIGFAIYDKDKNFVVGYNGNSEGLTSNPTTPQTCQCALPANAHYVRFTLFKDGTIDLYPMSGEIGNVTQKIGEIDAELRDARTGGDGKEYSTVGEAMRSQVKAVADGKLDKRNYQEVLNKHGNMFPIEGLSGLNITLGGVTVTADDESGVFTLNGTATTGNSIEIVTRGTEYGVVKGGEKYLAQLKYMSGECSDFANGKPSLLFGNITSGNLKIPWVVTDNSVRVSIEPSEDIILNRLAIGITAGVTYTNLRIAPYLALETAFDNEYEGGAYKFCADNLDVNIEKTIDAKISSFNNNLDGQLVPYMRDEAKRVNREAITENVDLNFIAFADPHLFDANKYTKYAKLMGLGGVDFMIGLGDYAPYAMQERKDRIVDLSNYLSMAGRGKDCFFAVGNHELDTLADGGTLTKKELHRCLCSHLNGAVKFNDLDPYGCYYYVDYDVAKVRVIVLNTSDMYDESGSYTNPNNSSLMMHQRQLTWFTETALNFKDKTAPSEWSVLTFGHTCWPFGGSPLQTILSAVKNGTALNQTWTVGGYTLSVNADYSTQGAVSVIGNIMGHSHNDVSEKSKEINCIQLRADNNVLDIPYTVAVDGLTAGAYFITADNGKKYGCTISTDYPAAKFISYNYSTVIVSRLTYMGLLILDENKMKIGEVRFTEADYNTSMTELTGFVADRVEGTATTESCYIININKENRTVTAIPYGVGCSGVIATY